ncbi:hypothetical protein D3P08_21565 [Paenibacillus nanensis]|uniref:Intracellular proteinase inhibitor BsuPI domain-containing protein n=1 Tax=Paenibacillus nanensis TaxID=393251 RepID=A0A3A1UNN3_9BACL|nr:hypothetical protein [Paenibacillus nanensis]RIX50139.1 hypothetical protein D3P08_21565 [Paenibacillus nanensis]
MNPFRRPSVVAAGALFLLLCACGSGAAGNNDKLLSTVPPAISEKLASPKLTHRDDLFELKLHIDQTMFKADEPIVLSASLTYIGEEESITIWGSSSAKVVFTLTDGKKFNMDGAVTTDLVPLELTRGEALEIPFSKYATRKTPTHAGWEFCFL